MNARDQVLITVAELAGRIRSAEPVTLLDVRWRFDEPDGHSAYLRGHLPGAVYVSLEDELSDHTVVGHGRHPLPSGRSLQAAARRWGIQRDGLVVAYDDWNRAGSARAWWVLTAAGVDNVRILDGGLDAWRSAEEPLETGPVTPPAGNVLVRHDDLAAGRRPTLTAQQCGSGAVPLLDTRAPERFRGDVEPVDPVAGHIPGATNLPSAAVLDCDGMFLDQDALTRLLSGRGIDPDGPVGAYCGSGITASVTVAALAAMGREAALYPGSWSEWSSDPTRPVARGAG
ncbi:sulfurtransferase [Mycobacterium persicum]|uniref:Sulfurtransferase n=1 Tax=Mycobacterium persicum TaxID=1487726 RepID=A0A8E2LNE8_9MYCO|nr:sulfurtransferase [Mycobacterium persicum]KZS85872.1 thiosulfate sulfurtransferase [Mycobacterium persicum]ORB57817.1 sulfurtransferase [Mycobacterium persicum]ORB93824.1 sulfurtransferase [Mycobacterium persicum]ORC00560.1 sulfurtransferase [Mycobacterium persicum]ORC05930.1 sulfurtransferase [Mycobacterium persicum]